MLSNRTQTPGVYFKWHDPVVPYIAPMRTDIVGFVGVAMHRDRRDPVQIESWGHFDEVFGGPIPHGYLAYAVSGFFANGGRRCWVVSVDPDDHRSGADPFDRGLAALDAVDDVAIVATPDLFPASHHLVPIPTPDADCHSLANAARRSGAATSGPAAAVLAPAAAPSTTPADPIARQRAVVAHCERRRDRFAILDPAPDLSPEQVGHPQYGVSSAFAALYYPWIRVPDPLRLDGLLRAVPPCGHIAGIYARGDLRAGVHKPPANSVVEGAQDVAVSVDDATHGVLNAASVNVIRPLPGRGIRVLGARTRDRTRPEWRYVNARRLMSMIEEAIDEQTQWSVFEPNNPALWADIEGIARAFVHDLWRRGMLDGAQPEDAYSVRCDATTNPPEETGLGRITCLVGVQPPWPAEFVTIRIGKTETITEVAEAGGRQDG